MSATGRRAPGYLHDRRKRFVRIESRYGPPAPWAWSIGDNRDDGPVSGRVRSFSSEIAKQGKGLRAVSAPRPRSSSSSDTPKSYSSCTGAFQGTAYFASGVCRGREKPGANPRATRGRYSGARVVEMGHPGLEHLHYAHETAWCIATSSPSNLMINEQGQAK